MSPIFPSATAGPRPRPAIDPSSFASRQLSLMVPELAVMLASTAICLGLFLLGSYAAVAVIAPLTILTTGVVANFVMIRNDSNTLLTPLFGIRLIALVVMGAGSLYHFFAPDFVRQSQDNLFVALDSDAAKANLVFIVGMDILLLGAAAGLRLFGRQSGHRRLSSLGEDALNVGLIAYLGGFVITTAAVVAATFELSWKIPSSIGTIGEAFEFTGLFIIGREFDRRLLAKVVLIAGLVAATFLSLISLNKSVLLYPALVAILGVISCRISVRRVVVGSAIIIGMFALIAPITGYTRIRNGMDHGQSGQATLGERIGYANEFINGGKLPGEQQPTMTRVDYIMPAAFVIFQYDTGKTSDILQTSAYMFIPRFLWPDKPITSNSGAVVSQLLGIQSINQIGVTTFGDLYWNAGWWGLLLVFPIGVYFGATAITSRNILADGDWIMFPFVLILFAMSLNLDKDFMASFIIPILMSTILFYALRFAGSLLPGAREAVVPNPPFRTTETALIR